MAAAPPPPTNQAEALAFYAAYHLPVTPVRPAEKKGRLSGWSTNSRGAQPSDFRPGDNVGVLNGTSPTADWFFHDVDIDANSDQARQVVEALLPPTGWRYGRESKPRSHANYLVKGQCRTRRHTGVDGKVIIELRGVTQKKTHTLSVGPGSTHPSGEAIRFVGPLGDIGRVEEPDALDIAVQHAAVGVVIAAAWPTQQRHNLRLAFAKVLLEHGVPRDRVVAVLEAVMRATGSDPGDVASVVADTETALASGRQTAGASVVTELLGHDVLTTVSSILRVGAQVDDGRSINVCDLTTTMVDRAWGYVVQANEPPGLFKRDDEVLILRDSANTCLHTLYEEQVKLEEPTLLQHISGFRKIEVETFREIVGRMVPCVEVRAKRTRTKVYPPREFASLMLASPTLPLPEPTGFTPIPFFTPEGRLVTTPGLHRQTGLFYQPRPDFALPEIPERPTGPQVAEAVSRLDAMVWQFPFKGRQGRHPYVDLREGCDWRETAAFANMLAFPLTILTRSLFHAVPLFLIDKPATRTGASLMVQCWCYILTGAWPSEAEWDGSESERRKFLTAILITGAPIIFLDEVKDLKSPDLNKILTGKNARVGRVLGSTEITTPHNYSTFVATGNNPAFPRDMAGRMCRVRLDTSTQQPSERAGWEKDLMSWVPEHRMELLAALYVLVRAWFAAGRPEHDEGRVLNGFEPWSVAVGGILCHAGIRAFLENKTDVEADAEAEDEDEMEELLEAWAAQYLNQTVSLSTLLALPELPTKDGAPWSGRILGSWLRRNRDRRRSLSNGTEVYVARRPARDWMLKSVDVQPELPSAGREPGADDVPF